MMSRDIIPKEQKVRQLLYDAALGLINTHYKSKVFENRIVVVKKMMLVRVTLEEGHHGEELPNIIFQMVRDDDDLTEISKPFVSNIARLRTGASTEAYEITPRSLQALVDGFIRLHREKLLTQFIWAEANDDNELFDDIIRHALDDNYVIIDNKKRLKWEDADGIIFVNKRWKDRVDITIYDIYDNNATKCSHHNNGDIGYTRFKPSRSRDIRMKITSDMHTWEVKSTCPYTGETEEWKAEYDPGVGGFVNYFEN